MDNTALEREIGEKRTALSRMQRAIAAAEKTPARRGVVLAFRIVVFAFGLFVGFAFMSERVYDAARNYPCP